MEVNSKGVGMKGSNPTKVQRKYWDALASNVGCIACAKERYVINNHVSIHHIDGRTKKHAHWLVLPLCAGHHQDGTGEDKGMIAVHPYKARFEDRYRTQYELYVQANERLKKLGYDFEREGWRECEVVDGFYEVLE